MMTIWKFIIILAVIYSMPSSYSTSFIHTIIDGSLSSWNRFRFNIFANNFEGVILFIIDSAKNQFRITVKKGKNNNKTIRINFNKKYIELLLQDICGCSECKDRNMEFFFRFDNKDLIRECNDVEPKFVSYVNNGNLDNILYPRPLSIANNTGKMYIMIGNIGPYVGENNVKVSPINQQLAGCLNSLTINDIDISFLNEGTKVLPSCPKLCVNNICNGGVCRETISSYNNIICDCFSTPFNEPFCNRSMEKYIEGGNNSYKMLEKAKKIYLKMTWRHISNKTYCLMEILGRDQQFIIWTNGSHLLMNNTIISHLNMFSTSFINIYITKDYIVIKINNKESKINFFLDEDIRINVGFSNRNKNCKTFENVYDIDYDMLEILRDEWNTTTEPPVNSGHQFYDKMMLITIIIVGVLFFIIIIIIVVCLIKGTLIVNFGTRNVNHKSSIKVKEGYNLEINNNEYDEHSDFPIAEKSPTPSAPPDEE